LEAAIRRFGRESAIKTSAPQTERSKAVAGNFRDGFLLFLNNYSVMQASDPVTRR
jgi:hypothetical protein